MLECRRTIVQSRTIRARQPSTSIVWLQSVEDIQEKYVCKMCGAVYKNLSELVEDEMDHVTPD